MNLKRLKKKQNYYKQSIIASNMKKITIIFLGLFMSVISYAQITINPYVRGRNSDGTIYKIELTNNETIVYIKFPKQNTLGGWIQFSSATVLVPSNAWSLENARKSKLEFPDFAPTPELAGLYADAIRRIREGRAAMSENGWLIRNLGQIN